jgi:nucleolar GTP-binding protein
MSYNFKGISAIPEAKELIDIILSKTQRKTPTEVHPQFQISRIRKFYMRKVKYAQSTIEEKITELVDKFPKINEIHPFYADLINVLYDKDHYKLALGHLSKARALCEHVAKDYVRMLKYADSLYRAKTLKRAALGRMCTILKKLQKSLAYLEEVRKHLARLPGIDPHTRSLIITGYPNVGKSSFMNQVTRANVEVEPYPFTTKSLFVGHTDYDYLTWQVIDTPGLLDRPISERNTIEMQAITALAHLNACVLFFIDISEECKHSIEEQVALFESVKVLFTNKPLGIVLTKVDVCAFSSLSPERQEMLQQVAADNKAFITQLSNVSGDGVFDCRNLACSKLREYREQVHSNKKSVIYTPRQPTVALPKPRDSLSRPANIPQSVINERLSGQFIERPVGIREIQEANGGAGVYSKAMNGED